MKLTKIRIPILSDEEVSMRCTHETLWPPPLVRIASKAPERWDVDLMWRTGEIQQHDYQQIETWQKTCGVLEMGRGCLDCHLSKLEEVVKYSNEVRHFPLKKLLEQRRQEAGLPYDFPLGETAESYQPESDPEPEPAPAPKEEPKVEAKPKAKKAAKKTTKRKASKKRAAKTPDPAPAAEKAPEPANVDAALEDFNRKKAKKLAEVEERLAAVKNSQNPKTKGFELAEPDYPLQDVVGTAEPESFDSQQDDEDDLLDALLDE
jgi:hypothetical protein